MKKLMVASFVSLGVIIPFANQQTPIKYSDYIEFKNYRIEMVEEVEEYKKVKIQLELQRQLEEQERLRQEELERQHEEEERNNLINKLGYEPSNIVRVNCKVTFYYADSTTLQGGYNDKKGIPLSSHNEPIVALPSDVTYGSYIEFDKEIRGNTLFKNVDTGGVIKWLDDNTIVVDVFVPEANSYNELINMVENTYATATIYYK